MSLTSATAQLMLSVTGLFTSPQQLQQFDADDIFNSEQVKIAETRMGVDGILSAGLVFNEKVMNIVLASNSPSIAVFNSWIAAMKAQGEVLPGSMTVLIKGIGIKFSCPKGFLTDYPPFPDLKKLVGPQKFTLRWEDVVPSPV